MPERSSARANLRFALAVLALLAVLPVAYLLFFGREPAPVIQPPAAPPPPPEPVELSLADVTGKVEIRRGNGPWNPARGDERLRSADAVRTGDGAHAVLRGGASEVEVRMDPGTEVSVEELTDSLSRVLLGNGMATARVAARSQRTFELRAAGSDAVARTSGGTFTVSNNGQGTVALGTREGEVAFLGRGKVVIVRAGQQSIVRSGEGPTAPAPLPTSLLLKVQWPSEPELRKRELLVQGQAAPGARLEIQGRALTPDASGRFSERVTLKEGANRVEVRGVSVGGAERTERRDVTVDTTPPKVGVDRGMWK